MVVRGHHLCAIREHRRQIPILGSSIQATGDIGMKVQQIRQSIGLQGLEDWGVAGLPGTTPAKVSGVQRVIRGSELIDTGVFECTPGTYRRSVKQAEVMDILAGRGRFTPDGEDAVHFAGGDTLFFEANTEGLWEVDETMRKVYVIL
jgi:uncharacterized cupin superfamily protein